jgi:type III restriction enzyme
VELKDYQRTALNEVKNYLELLSKEKESGNTQYASLAAWENGPGLKEYHRKHNGLGEDLPNFCLKIPTGGGKTLLAVKTIDLINTYYSKKQNGLVLWVVPTTQIYYQTLQNLRNREHPYRQQLDIASAGKTIIMERAERLTPEDIAQNLVILVLMLPAANRKIKETLKMYMDNGSYTDFFPDDDHLQQHNEILEKFRNLDVFDDQTNIFYRRQIKTSLGNVLKVLQPIIILDESQKAYSDGAKETLYGFNPSIVCELSATPPEGSNILVNVSGRTLEKENMLKLDLHLINKGDPDWKHTLRSSIEKLNELNDKAKDYEAETGEYIRPIMVIQVERTGRDQRDGQHIHSEVVKEYLISTIGIPPQQVAIKTSDKDDLKDISNEELMGKGCCIKFIITKQALQEGWDCSFAYVLTVLNNPRSQTALTQLVGRILRQPYARKTHVKHLDESYVFTYQRATSDLVESITKGFEEEGLSDLTSRIFADEGQEQISTIKKVGLRNKYETVVRQIMLPIFVVSGPNWRPVNYETDIASKINWNNIELKPLFNLKLTHNQQTDRETAINFTEDGNNELVTAKRVVGLGKGGFDPEPMFLARHLLEIVPNPWSAYEISQGILDQLLAKNSKEVVIDNFGYVIQQTLLHLENIREHLAKRVFYNMINEDKMRFIVAKKAGYQLPKTREIDTTTVLSSKDKLGYVQRSLFEYESAADMNELEKDVAWFLDDQQKLFFWFRNVDRKQDSYYLQGWRKNKIYPDFLFTIDDKNDGRVNRIYVTEIKGDQLVGNDDTAYKKELLAKCNELAVQKEFNELALEMQDRKVEFEIIQQGEWQQKLREIFA